VQSEGNGTIYSRDSRIYYTHTNISLINGGERVYIMGKNSVLRAKIQAYKDVISHIVSYNHRYFNSPKGVLDSRYKDYEDANVIDYVKEDKKKWQK
jgi:hypothetical protein